MRTFVTHYLHAPTKAGSNPEAIHIWGQFETVSDARRHAEIAATTGAGCRDWCVAFEIEDPAEDEAVFRWEKERPH